MTSRSKTFFFFFLLLLVLSLFLLLFLLPIFSPTHLRQTERSSGDRRCIQMALSKEYSKGGGKKKKRAHNNNNNNSNDNNNNKGTEACGANTHTHARSYAYAQPRSPTNTASPVYRGIVLQFFKIFSLGFKTIFSILRYRFLILNFNCLI